jgi:hypothetical protein
LTHAAVASFPWLKIPPWQSEAVQHVISGAEQAPLLMVQLQAPQVCWVVGGWAESFSGITAPPGHMGFTSPAGVTRTALGPSHPSGTASMQTEPSSHRFIPVPVDELLETVLLVVEPPPLPEPEGEPPPPTDELLPPLPPAPVSSNVNGVGTHAATDMTTPNDAIARRLALLALLAPLALRGARAFLGSSGC